MLDLTINKEFLDSYRDYKIDLIEDKTKTKITFVALELIISEGFMSLQDLYHELDGYDTIVVCVLTGEIKERNKLSSSDMTMKELQDYVKYITEEQRRKSYGSDGSDIKYYGDD